MNKEVRDLINQLEKVPGVTVENASSGHPRVYLDGNFIASIPGSPSDSRWKKNTVLRLRRKGIDLAAAVETAKRPSGGQAPPPLPEFKTEKEKPVATASPPKTELEILSDDIDFVFNSAEKHFAYPHRTGHKLGFGVMARLAEIVQAYSESSGTEIPRPDYRAASKTAKMNDTYWLAEKCVGVGSDIYFDVTPVEKITAPTIAKADYLVRAWLWWTVDRECDESILKEKPSKADKAIMEALSKPFPTPSWITAPTTTLPTGPTSPVTVKFHTSAPTTIDKIDIVIAICNGETNTSKARQMVEAVLNSNIA